VNTLKAVFYAGKECISLQHKAEFAGLHGKESNDFDLKYWIVRQNLKITLLGRSSQKMGLSDNTFNPS